MSNPMVCATCGTQEVPKKHTPGSILIEIALWVCLIVPGLIYSLWRVSARRSVCRACGGQHLVPPDSPVAQQLAARR